MSLELYLVFALASALLGATPGPNVALIVGTSLRHGATAGLLTAAGVNVGAILQLSAIALGLTWIVELFARHFDLIRYARGGLSGPSRGAATARAEIGDGT